MTSLTPLYIWAGGKRKMIPKYKESPSIPYTGYDTFVEPFFGGGAMMCHIAEYSNCKHYVINDVKAELVGIYRAIQSDCTNFVKQMDVYQSSYLPLEKPRRKDFYYSKRQSYIDDYDNRSPTENASLLYFLMRTCFNGIWQVTKTSNGKFFTPSGLLGHEGSIYDRDSILEWNKFLQKATIMCGDWNDCTNAVEGSAFYFFDPPYRDSFTSYGGEFDDTAQIALLDWCKNARDNDIVWLCNRDSDDGFWTSRLGNLKLEAYDVTYTAGRRSTEDDGSRTAKSAKEVLIYNECGLFSVDT